MIKTNCRKSFNNVYCKEQKIKGVNQNYLLKFGYTASQQTIQELDFFYKLYKQMKSFYNIKLYLILFKIINQ